MYVFILVFYHSFILLPPVPFTHALPFHLQFILQQSIYGVPTLAQLGAMRQTQESIQWSSCPQGASVLVEEADNYHTIWWAWWTGVPNVVEVLRGDSFYLERSGKTLGRTNHWSHILKGCRNIPGAEGGCGKSFGTNLWCLKRAWVVWGGCDPPSGAAWGGQRRVRLKQLQERLWLLALGIWTWCSW